MEVLIPIDIEKIYQGQRLVWFRRDSKRFECKVTQILPTPDYIKCNVYEDEILEYRNLSIRTDDLRAVKNV